MAAEDGWRKVSRIFFEEEEAKDNLADREIQQDRKKRTGGSQGNLTGITSFEMLGARR